MNRVTGLLTLSSLIFALGACAPSYDPLPAEERSDLGSEFDNYEIESLDEGDFASAGLVTPLREMPDVRNYQGDSLTLTSTVDTLGLTNLAYAWYKNGRPLVVANNQIAMNPITIADSGVYQMDVMLVGENGVGQRIYSDVAIIEVRPASERPQAPVITFQTANVNTNVNRSHVFEVGATGNPAPTIQWYKDGQILPGETRSSLRINPISMTDAGVYRATISNDAGEIRSRTMRMRVAGAQCLINGRNRDPGYSRVVVTCRRPVGRREHSCVGNQENPGGLADGQEYRVLCLDDGRAVSRVGACIYRTDDCES